MRIYVIVVVVMMKGCAVLDLLQYSAKVLMSIKATGFLFSSNIS